MSIILTVRRIDIEETLNTTPSVLPQIKMTAQLNEDRIWIDGCFDFVHHGHACAMLQARRTSNNKENSMLFCGVHNDAAIEYNKGTLPVMNAPERYAHARSIRWCSAVVEDAPYVTAPEWMDRFGCQYVIHGDDVTLDANGEDCYTIMRKMNRFKMVKRTYGVSTTDIIHRILTHNTLPSTDKDYFPTLDELEFCSKGVDGFSNHCYVFQDDLNNMLVRGGYDWDSTNSVLILGDFDLFHMGHIDQLKKIRNVLEPRRQIIIGVTSNESKEIIMTIKERVLSLLSCSFVDGVIIHPSKDTIENSSHDEKSKFSKVYNIDSPELVDGTVFSGYLTSRTIIARIETQRDMYVERNKRKGMPI
ncbi:hypothetical protein NCAS_0A05190 [Naumovozyma castellii]|uniref:ethanolamine-phosphate cytidylyltransferase n=1 Tax=Naumovozyma castellii TaxID=27288 RepID=G0V6I4_NAUCA|nr:hypothetical protein NCAS_0A05190 [Naumovozyma castellii CBS 4309]CCC67077.1 hypothetical protein NCAS_0A05190 [Naumovozyma castellii CBS 4309]